MSITSGREFENKVAFVTGAARGIGRATARIFAEGGAAVVLADLNGRELDIVSEECKLAGSDILAIVADLRQSGEVCEAIGQAAQRFGRIDILANVAGIFPLATIADTTDELWDDVLRTNLTGTFYCCRAVIPIMQHQKAGNIVNVASGAAVRGLPHLAAYGASKAGVIGFSRTLALEVGPGVRVNVVAPGPVNTQGEAGRESPTGVPSTVASINDIPLGRSGEPNEIAEVISFLASDRASFVHGQVYHVNGGRIMP